MRPFTETNINDLIRAAYEAGQKDAASPHKDAAPKVNYLNAVGDPEYASIHLTLDHSTSAGKQKLMLNMGTAEETLYELFDYYGERTKLMALPSTLEQLVASRMNPERGIFLYVVPEEAAVDRMGGLITQAIMSTVAWAELVRHPMYGNGSEWKAVQKLVDAFRTVLFAERDKLGSFPPLVFLALETMPDLEPVDQDEDPKTVLRRLNRKKVPKKY